MPQDCRPSAVLDTNSTLDWLLFRDPPALELGRLIVAGALIWRASPVMRREFDRVLGRDSLAGWQPDAAAAGAAWASHAQIELEPPAGPLNCTDPDDQVFIDLALQHRCRWLVTRDRALLKLARRATLWQLTVVTPQGWLKHCSMSALGGAALRA